MIWEGLGWLALCWLAPDAFFYFFYQLWAPLGTYLEVVLLAFPAIGHPFCLWASGV